MEVGTAHVHVAGEVVGGEFDVVHVFFDDGDGAFEEGFVHGVEGDLFGLYFEGFGVTFEHAPAGTEHVLYFGGDHGEDEGFGDVVVGSDLQAFHLVFDVGFGGEHDDGDVAGADVLLDGFAEFDAVHYGHHDVGNDDVDFVFFKYLEGFFAVGSFDDVEEDGEAVAEVLGYLGVVFNDEYGTALLVGILDGAGFGVVGVDEVHFLGVGGMCRGFIGVVGGGGGELAGFVEGDVLGKVDGEGAAFSFVAIELDVAVMEFDEALNEGEADAAAYVFAFDLVEAFEYFGLFVDGDADAGIGDTEHEVLVFLSEGDGDALVGAGVFEGVGQEVVDDEFEVVGVEQDVFFLQVGVEGVVDLFVAGEFIVVEEVFAHELVGVGFLYFELEDSEFGPAVVHELVD